MWEKFIEDWKQTRSKDMEIDKNYTSNYDGNKVAYESVRNHLIVKINDCEEAESKAILEGKIQSEIDMWHDMKSLYLGFLAQM